MKRPLIRQFDYSIIRLFAALALCATAAAASAMPLGLRLTQQAAAAKGAAEKDPLLLTEAEAYERYAPDTAFVIDLDLAGTTTISLNPAQHGVGNSYIKIDWGDGTVEENCFCWYHGTEHYHTYAKSGRYVIRTGAVSDVFYERETKLGVLRVLRWADFPKGTKMTGGLFGCKTVTAFPDGSLARWPSGVTSLSLVYYGCTGLNVTKLPAWPSGVTSLSSVYSGCTGLNVTKLPKWPEGLTTLVGHGGWGRGFYTGPGIRPEKIPEWPNGLERIEGCVYDGCVNIKSTVPKWPSSLKQITLPDYNTYNTRCVYQDCTGLYGDVPAWPDTLEYANFVYSGCSGLTGRIPDWPATLTQIKDTYRYCTGLTGAIPQKWPDGVTAIGGVYSGCTGLTGAIPQKWPDGVTSLSSVYAGCTGLTFTELPAWPETLVTCNSVYYNTFPASMREQCKGLVIPKWPANVQYAAYTYRYCGGLTGSIPAWGEAMKEVSLCYDGCSGLTGAWTTVASELMPTNITSHASCVTGTSSDLRALFYSDWGGNRPKEE